GRPVGIGAERRTRVPVRHRHSRAVSNAARHGLMVRRRRGLTRLTPTVRSACLILLAVLAAMAQAPAPQMQEGFADLGGVRLWYRDSGGAGVPVVFLHAATGSSRVWEHQEGPFTAAGVRIIEYDRRGFGRTVVAQAAATTAAAATG